VSARDRDLVRLHWPVELRPAFDALLAIDDALADITLTASQPALAAITLAWWREALERLDTSAAPAEPRLQGATAHLLPAGLSGAALSQLEPAWGALLDEDAGPAQAARRGEILFALGAALLRSAPVEGAGAAFGQADLARRTGSRRWIGDTSSYGRPPKVLRPLTALDALAARDIQGAWPPEPEASPGRAWTLLRHRWTGRIDTRPN
jgi:phytoene synthase